ncbi:hypothetical protein Adt_16302 [Abeliophyllum distichum]|uniref:Uncharacterized protein n=1 Tax=Abeliophyllum distichum TaxID=126358 RepID=A0ABD1TD96_9LAMI
MLGHGSPVSPNPHAGHTSHQTGPTPSQSIQLTAILGTAPSETAAFSTGRAPIRPPPVGAPSSGEQFDRSFDHSLAPANLGPGQTRGFSSPQKSQRPISLSPICALNFLPFQPSI